MSHPIRAFLLFVLVGCGDDAAPPTQGGTTSLDDSTTAPDESTTAPDESTTAPDGTTAIDTDATELDCPGVFDCVAACPDGDDPCVEACVADASAEAIMLVDAVLACANANGCVDEDCLAMNCAAEVLACAGEEPSDTETGGPACESVGTPEMTGPVTGLQGSYPAGDPIDVGVPVDEDTARVIVGIYEVGSKLYLGGTAEDVEGPTTATLSFFAGVAGGETGEFYLAIELCSTSVCTPPFVRNTYDREDRTAPLRDGETYVQTRELVGGDGTPEACETEIPIQSFLIE